MAMRIYAREEFRAELQNKWRLTATGQTTATTEIWLTPKGRPISVPELEGGQYPNSLLNIIEEQLRALNEHPFQAQESATAQSPPSPR